MVILNSQQVEFCSVVRQINGQVTTLPGIEFQGRLFVEGEPFGLSQRKNALARVREVLDRPGCDLLVAIVKTADKYTLWYLDPTLRKLASGSTAIAA